jgi:cytochrome P450
VEAGCDRDGIIQNLHSGLHQKAVLNRLYPFLKVVKSTWLGQKYLESSSKDISGLGILMNLRDRLLDARLNDIKCGNEGRHDLLLTLLQARTPQGEPLSIPNIKSEILLVLLAGADTTATTMQGLIHYCITRPDIYQRLTKEIDEAEKNGNLSAMPQYEEVSKHCPYYVACIREILRLWPPSPALFPRVVSGCGIDFNGKLAPPGTEVASTPFLIHRDKELYGPDAEEFVPERWLDPEQCKLYLKYSFTFGYGARVCLGKDIAQMEIYKAPMQVCLILVFRLPIWELLRFP